MHFPAWPHGCWPNDTQRLLLRACVDENGDTALAAWRQWEARIALDSLESGSSKLIPILYRRLLHLEDDHPLLPRLQGVARWHWVKYKFLMRDLRKVLASFHEHGIPTILLKGAALNGTVFPAGVRPMDDSDVFIRRSHAPLALQLLQEQGWQAAFEVEPQLIEVTHSIPLRHRETETHLDLHWDYCHGRFLTEEAHQELWEHGRPAPTGPDSTRVLSPTDQLLHTCEHGTRYVTTAPFRWLVDTACLLKTHVADIDWQRLATTATRQQMTLPLKSTMSYLRQHGLVALTEEAREALDSLRPSWLERVEHRIVTRKPFGMHPFVRTLPSEVLFYRRLRSIHSTRGFADYLRLVNNINEPVRRHVLQVARVVTVSAWSRLRRRIDPFCRGLSFDDIADDALEGFYPPEYYHGELFRWTGPTASIRLPLAGVPYEITLQLASFRSLSKLALELTLRFNRQWVLREAWKLEGGKITFRVDPEMFVERAEQRLEVRCSRWSEATSDPRQLGIPLIGVRYRNIPRLLRRRPGDVQHVACGETD